MTSFYTSLNGLKNSQTDLSTIAHNIANAETTGFKKSSVEFADIVANGSAANPRMTMGSTFQYMRMAESTLITITSGMA